MFRAMAYSMDLRERVVRAHAECGSSEQVAEQFDVSASWVRRMVQLLRETDGLAPRSSARRDDQRAYDDADEARIRQFIKDKPDATLAEVIGAVGKPASPATASRTLLRLGLPRKKSRRTPPSASAPTSSPPAPHG